MNDSNEIAYLGAGCFWSIELKYQNTKGVIKTSVGYMGGSTENPTYKEVCSGNTSHVEVVCMAFDPKIVSYEEILDIFWQIHDPTALNKQGPDIGSQYRSVIFYTSESQKEKAEKSKNNNSLDSNHEAPIVTTIEPAQLYYLAEDYHQSYLAKMNR